MLRKVWILILYFFVSSCVNNSIEEVDVTVNYVRCKTGSIGSRSLVKVKFRKKIYNVAINKSTCKNIKLGDTISLFYNLNRDRVIELIK